MWIFSCTAHGSPSFILSAKKNWSLLGQVLVVAGGGEGTGDAKDDDLLAFQGGDIQILGDSAGMLQRSIEGAVFQRRVRVRKKTRKR